MSTHNLSAMLVNEKLVSLRTQGDLAIRLSYTSHGYYIETSGGEPVQLTEDQLLDFIRDGLFHVRNLRVARVRNWVEGMGR